VVFWGFSFSFMAIFWAKKIREFAKENSLKERYIYIYIYIEKWRKFATKKSLHNTIKIPLI
jgi:hypothetical protein